LEAKVLDTSQELLASDVVSAIAGVPFEVFLGMVEGLTDKNVSLPVIPRIDQLDELEGFVETNVMHATVLLVAWLVPGDEQSGRL
jgi:hypothetical protein